MSTKRQGRDSSSAARQPPRYHHAVYTSSLSRGLTERHTTTDNAQATTWRPAGGQTYQRMTGCYRTICHGSSVSSCGPDSTISASRHHTMSTGLHAPHTSEYSTSPDYPRTATGYTAHGGTQRSRQCICSPTGHGREERAR